MKEKKVLKNILVGAAAVSVLTWAGFGLVERHWDHEEKLCPFNSILGLSHQAMRINMEAKEGTRAYFVDDGTLEITMDARKVEIDGVTYNVAPMGTIIEGDKVVATYTVPTGECVVVVEGLDNNLEAPEIVSYITEEGVTRVR